MPLTVRSNGSTSANIITSSWFNDYYNLLTGAMQDQEVTIKNVLILQAIGGAPATAPTATLAAGSVGPGVGAYVYTVTFANADGETTIGPTVSITTTTGNRTVNLAAIPLGPTGTTARKLYRTVVGGGTSYKLLTTINDNTTTTYSDIIADASLGAAPPASPTFGGALIIKDQSGVVKFKINNDGSFSSGGTTGFGNTTINGTLTVTGTSSLDNGAITTDGTGQITLPNNKALMSKDTGGTVRNLVYLDASNRLCLRAGGGNEVRFLDSTGAFLGWFNTNGGGLNSTAGVGAPTMFKFGNGFGFDGVHFFSGTGNVTVAHGYGSIPLLIVPVQNVAGSQTMGYNTLGSTNVTVATGAGNAWEAIALG